MSNQEGYVPGSEAYLAAVWYVMNDARAAYERNRADVRQGRLNRWWYLNKVRRTLELKPSPLSYREMREELKHFAETFGVGEESPLPLSDTDLQAQRAFGGMR